MILMCRFVSIEPSDEALPNLDETSESGHPQRARKPKGAYKLMHEGMSAAIALTDLEDETYYPDTGNFALISIGLEPQSLEEALRGPNSVEWNDALKYEISQLEKLGTWVIEDLPKGEKPIPYSEVLKEKRGPDGRVETRHVCIVAGGHRQVEGVNYTKTFAAAAKLPSVRCVLANTAELDWEIHQIDVKSAYLNAPLKETVYMKISEEWRGMAKKEKLAGC